MEHHQRNISKHIVNTNQFCNFNKSVVLFLKFTCFFQTSNRAANGAILISALTQTQGGVVLVSLTMISNKRKLSFPR
jgi:hypothetical protein